MTDEALSGRRARTGEPGGSRRLPVVGFIVIAAVYLAIVQFGSLVLTSGLDTEYGKLQSVEEVVRGLVLPVGISLVFVYAVVAVLGWWHPVFVDDRPVAKWVAVVPIVFVIVILLGTNYPGLLDQGAAFILLLGVGALMVGFAEEGMFRGLGVVAFRSNGYSESRVALWTCVLFGVAHSTNLFTEGPGALAQVLATIVAGYFFYLIRRRTGGLWAAAVLHGFWDFGLLSTMMDDSMYLGAGLFLLADIVLVIVLLARRRTIELRTA